MTKARAGLVKTDKGQQTRAAILEAALEMFREQGYEQTTMRAIADRAGVALGNAYYYFHSKEHLIQAFYGRTHEEHVKTCDSVLAEEREGVHGQGDVAVLAALAVTDMNQHPGRIDVGNL